jgi:hypothetical protein
MSSCPALKASLAIHALGFLKVSLTKLRATNAARSANLRFYVQTKPQVHCRGVGVNVPPADVDIFWPLPSMVLFTEEMTLALLIDLTPV